MSDRGAAVVAALAAVGTVGGFSVSYAFLAHDNVRLGYRRSEPAPGADALAFRASEQARTWVIATSLFTGGYFAIAAALFPTWHDSVGALSATDKWIGGVAAPALVLAAWLLPGWYRLQRIPADQRVGRFWWLRASRPSKYPLACFEYRIAAAALVLGGIVVAAVLAMAAAARNAWTDARQPGLLRDRLADVSHDQRLLALYLAVSVVLLLAMLSMTALIQRALVAHDPHRWASMHHDLDMVLYGGLCSLLLAAVFVPSYAVVRASAWHVVDAQLAVSKTGPPSGSWFDQRADLVHMLSLDVSVSSVFAPLLAIATPVIAAYVTRRLTSTSERVG